jgi:hypothetical protein
MGNKLSHTPCTPQAVEVAAAAVLACIWSRVQQQLLLQDWWLPALLLPAA